MLNYTLNNLHVLMAGSWPLIWHWGLAIGVILLLLAAFVATYFIPFFGALLGKFRADLLIAAAVVAAMQALFVWGTHTEAKRCKAQVVVVQKIVTKVVTKVQRPSTKKWRDPWDAPK